MKKKILLAAAGFLCLLLGMSTAFADGLPELSAQWWQYVSSIPPGVNPLLDATGTDCMVAQRGPIRFLMGAFGGGTVTRSCTVPAGETLFFPIVNNVNFNAPNVCGLPPENETAKDLRAQIAPLIDAVTNLSVEVDGNSVSNVVRIKSRVFAITLPADNIYNAGCGGPGSVPAGVYSPAVDDGYYVRLNPLPVGKHVVHFHGEVPAAMNVQDVTYNLIIAPVSLK